MKKQILVVEDEQAIAAFVQTSLEREGFSVSVAHSGEDALAQIQADSPELIILDLVLPGIDGFEVCRRLKSDAHSRHVPVIFISAHIETAKKVEGFKAGGVDYIAKPFEREEVLARVETQLRLHELTERLEQQVDRRTRQLRQEILAREQAQAALSREAGINSATAELSRNLLSPSSVDDIAFLVLEQAKHLTGSAFGYVGHIDPETGYLVCPTLTRDIWDKCRVADKDIVFKKFTGLWGWY
jgi:DNA-binding response OmpR family regulator